MYQRFNEKKNGVIDGTKTCPICGHAHLGQYGKYCPNCANLRQHDIVDQNAKYRCNICGKAMLQHGTCILCQNKMHS